MIVVYLWVSEWVSVMWLVNMHVCVCVCMRISSMRFSVSSLLVRASRFVIFACLFIYASILCSNAFSLTQNIYSTYFDSVIRVRRDECVSKRVCMIEWVEIFSNALREREIESHVCVCVYVIHVDILYFVAVCTIRSWNDRHTFEPIFFRHLFLVGIKLRTVSIVHCENFRAFVVQMRCECVNEQNRTMFIILRASPQKKPSKLNSCIN